MNSCILMAEIIQSPELRYTSDSQTPIAEMMVQFPGLRPDDPPSKVKVVGWGNLAQEIQEKYHQGDRVVIEGRLSMNTIDRPEGFKEKRAELTAQRIHSLGADTVLEVSSVSTASGMGQPTATFNRPSVAATATAKPPTVKATPQPAPITEPDFDDIPF